MAIPWVKAKLTYALIGSYVGPIPEVEHRITQTNQVKGPTSLLSLNCYLLGFHGLEHSSQDLVIKDGGLRMTWLLDEIIS